MPTILRASPRIQSTACFRIEKGIFGPVWRPLVLAASLQNLSRFRAFRTISVGRTARAKTLLMQFSVTTTKTYGSLLAMHCTVLTVRRTSTPFPELPMGLALPKLRAFSGLVLRIVGIVLIGYEPRVLAVKSKQASPLRAEPHVPVIV